MARPRPFLDLNPRHVRAFTPTIRNEWIKRSTEGRSFCSFWCIHILKLSMILLCLLIHGACTQWVYKALLPTARAFIQPLMDNIVHEKTGVSTFFNRCSAAFVHAFVSQSFTQQQTVPGLHCLYVRICHDLRVVFNQRFLFWLNMSVIHTRSWITGAYNCVGYGWIWSNKPTSGPEIWRIPNIWLAWIW